MMGNVPEGIVYKVSFQAVDLTVNYHCVMGVYPAPSTLETSKQPDLAVRIPACVVNPPAEIEYMTWDGIGIRLWPFQDLFNLGCKFGSDPFIGIYGEYPLMGGLIYSEVLLGNMTGPLIIEHPVRILFAYFNGPVGASRLNNNNLVSPFDAFQGIPDVLFFIQGYYCDGEFFHNFQKALDFRC